MLEPIYKTLTSTETRSIWSTLVFGNCHMPILPEKKKKLVLKEKIYFFIISTHTLSLFPSSAPSPSPSSFYISLPFSYTLLIPLHPSIPHFPHLPFSSPYLPFSLSIPSLLLLVLPFIPSLFCFFSTFPLLFSLSPLHEPSLRKNRNRGRSATSP